MLIVLRAMLAAEPEKRPPAKRVKKCFASAIKEIPNKGGEGVALHCLDVDREEKKRRRREAELAVQRERKMKEEKEKEKAKKAAKVDLIKDEEPFLDSTSVSEFDFGFSDGGSDSETNEGQEDQADVVDRSILEEDVPIQVDRVSPQLSLPILDVHISGIEGLTFRHV
jgi:hypothetical protein